MTRASRPYCFAQAMDSGGGLDCRQVDDAAFGFGDDFVFDDEDVAGLEADVGLAQSRRAVCRRVSRRGGFRRERGWGSGAVHRGAGLRSSLARSGLILAIGRISTAAHVLIRRRFAAGRSGRARPTAILASVSGSAYSRARRWARVSPGSATSWCRSSGLSTSTAIPGRFSTTHGLPGRLRGGVVRFEAVVAEAQRK